MDMGMKIEVFAKGVEGENDGWMRFGFAECGAQIKGGSDGLRCKDA
jgi:hypothetical protein